jgi:hypothetical protein
LEVVAGCRGVSAEEVGAAVFENSRAVFFPDS